MKKLVLFFAAAAFAVTFAACGNKAADKQETEEAPAVEQVEQAEPTTDVEGSEVAPDEVTPPAE